MAASRSDSPVPLAADPDWAFWPGSAALPSTSRHLRSRSCELSRSAIGHLRAQRCGEDRQDAPDPGLVEAVVGVGGTGGAAAPARPDALAHLAPFRPRELGEGPAEQGQGLLEGQ